MVNGFKLILAILIGLIEIDLGNRRKIKRVNGLLPSCANYSFKK